MSTRIFAPLTIGFLLATPVVRAQAPTRGDASVEVVGPLRVIDGDTLEVQIDSQRVAAGLIGIKAPNPKTPCGRKAADVLRDLTRGRLRLTEDPDRVDARKRRMYYLTLEDGASAAIELVRAGVALPDGPSLEAEGLAQAAADAAGSGTACVARN
jgi:endonuclease YncB( thermonuclease family)